MKRTFALSLAVGAIVVVAASRRASPSAQDESVTFSKQIVRIFQERCQTCHHPGDIGPFSLMAYRDAKTWARSIKDKVAAREMPPWKAAEGCTEFDGERRLTDPEMAAISNWVDAGAPEGDPADLPPPLTFPDGWSLGRPDAVLQPDADYSVKAGEDIYRCFSLPTDIRGERFISAVEIRPSNRSVVHHVIIYIDEFGLSKALDDADPGPGYTSFGGPGFATTGTLGGWAPGIRSRFESDGNGWRLPAGARIVTQVHYHPHGPDQETDRTQVGLYFSRQPVRKELRVLPFGNENFAIPAGDSHYRVTASFIVPPGSNSHLISIAPHMHLLGKEMTVNATLPGGSTRCLVIIPDWDFRWQSLYYFKDPMALVAGTRLSLTAYYDNSSDNPRNPNSPPKTVRYGEQTTDEMCYAFIEFTLDSESRDVSAPRVSSVAVDSSGVLVVNGKGFTNSSDIEVDGERIADTKNHKKKTSKRLLSSDDWKELAPPGRTVSVTVLNGDGARSAPLSFTR